MWRILTISLGICLAGAAISKAPSKTTPKSIPNQTPVWTADLRETDAEGKDPETFLHVKRTLVMEGIDETRPQAFELRERLPEGATAERFRVFNEETDKCGNMVFRAIEVSVIAKKTKRQLVVTDHATTRCDSKVGERIEVQLTGPNLQRQFLGEPEPYFGDLEGQVALMPEP